MVWFQATFGNYFATQQLCYCRKNGIIFLHRIGRKACIALYGYGSHAVSFRNSSAFSMSEAWSMSSTFVKV